MARLTQSLILTAGCLIPLLCVRASAAVDVMASAITPPAGQPYGVAMIEIPLATPIVGQTPPPVRVDGPAGRVLYPVAEEIETRITPPSELPVPEPGNGRLLGRLGKLIRELTDENAPKTQIVGRRVTLLFRGTEPLKLRLLDGDEEIGTYELIPQDDALAFQDLALRWWQAYTERAKEQIDQGDYPPWVETYLTAMLSGRTSRGLPDWFLEKRDNEDPLWVTLKLLGGAEQVTREVFRRTAAGLTDDDQPQAARDSQPELMRVPAGPAWQPAELPAVDPSVKTEPIASRVPPECFYLRFGSFQNYLWLLDLTTEHGGDLGRMITLRGTGGKTTERFERQLNLKINQLTRMLGPSVIEDQAVIGRDMFLDDGASMGVIMKAANAFLLRSSLNNDRSNRANSDGSVTLKTVSISGRDVSLLSSLDNQVRSFMAEDNGYVLVTNSETIVRRFFEVGESGKSLASTKSFRLSRQLVPTDRNDTIFVYFSPQMLQGLVAPEYLIELRRRIEAKSDIALVHLARLAAAAEGLSSEDGDSFGVDELIESGFLPVSFGNLADGSGVVTLGETVIDTMRGARGTFLPIADIEVESVTPQEHEWYSEIAAEYSKRFPQMDPIMLALRREDLPEDPSLERITIHAEIAPLTPEKYGKWAEQLGPPTKVAMRSAPDDLVALQAHVASETIGPPTHLFAGIKDSFPPQPEDFEGILNAYRSLRQLPGYLGAWPQPGALDRLPLGLGRGRPVGPGMSRLIGGLYRYTGGGFSVLSFQPEVLNASLPFMEAIEVDTPATVRGRIGSLLGSRLEGWVNEQLYQRAAKSSQAGAEFLNLLGEQLQVRPEDSLEIAETILGKPLQCSLGGEYEYNTASMRWRSTAWSGPQPPSQPPADYVAPLLNWFRGGEFTMIQYSDRLVADAVVTVAREGE
jgi:hypothetical protein